MGNPDCLESWMGSRWVKVGSLLVGLGETPLVGLLGLGETPPVGLLGLGATPHVGLLGLGETPRVGPHSTAVFSLVLGLKSPSCVTAVQATQYHHESPGSSAHSTRALLSARCIGSECGSVLGRECTCSLAVTIDTGLIRHHVVWHSDLTRLGWLHFGHSLYYFSTTKKNWAASRDDCLERDADLVVINSREEQLCCHDNRYHYYLKQEFVSRQGGDHWIGLSDGDPEGTWKWVDGTNMTSSSWGPGEPSDDGGGEDCVATSLGDGWNDKPCADQYRWICEKVVVLDHLEAELNKEVMLGREAPQISVTPSFKTVSVGKTAIFSCRAGGRPQPTIQWLQDGRLLETDGTDNRSASVVRMDGGDLVLRGVRSGGETFLCMANNSAGTANQTAQLVVYEVKPDGWLHYHHSLYYFSTAEKNWVASRDYCLGRDADLVVINSREEEEFVSRQAGDHWTWIGLSDRDTEGTWKWVDGTNMTSSFWKDGEPNNYDGMEDCGVTSVKGGWNDVSCTRPFPWICEKV
ncbi:C-type lectin domain family 10 member A [Merluccius polli]|uniref:C-type lectin domain family 10 member A n=1 Tax=Merluccius polli TaxID=89951 RepID=A0AA47M3M6_MERPO|nr:C-type lectin domain family 10 member A [Merluccius polli]